mmetsp:Transcript_10124/g.41761  ORF Transcript_10124/g.41761 Transcript_10124/m.41761 type:complete len:296 (-) Transcript_10124:76-963(-)
MRWSVRHFRSVSLRADIISHLVHCLLDLPQPDFIDFKRSQYKAYYCTPAHRIHDPRYIYSHILRTAAGICSGSRTKTRNRTYASLARHAAHAGYAVYLEQRGVIPPHHTRTNGKIPDFTTAREGGVLESVDFTMATVLTCTHDATKPTPVSHNRERANTHTGVGIKISEARKTIEYPPETAGQQQDHHHRRRMHWAFRQKRSRMVQGHREAPSRTPTPAAPPRPEHHQRARHIRSRGHQEVPLQRRRSTTRAPQTEHGVVHRNHCKSTQQTRRRRARGRRETRHDLRLMLTMGSE